MTNRHHTSNGGFRSNNVQRDQGVTWVGNCCGRHGSYVFYKAFRFRLDPQTASSQNNSNLNTSIRSRSSRGDRRHNSTNDVTDTKISSVKEESNSEQSDLNDSLTTPPSERILGLGEFFFVQCRPEDPVCVGELQLLWHDKHSGQDLVSTRLYYVPETTPAGRNSLHGEDEMLAVSEKIVMRITDLASWVVEPDEWNYGSTLLTCPSPKNGHKVKSANFPILKPPMLPPSVNMNDVKMEKRALATSLNGFCTTHTQEYNEYNEVVSNINQRTNISSNADSNADSTPQNCTQCAKRHQAGVIMLSVGAYCRHKAIMKRIEGMERDWLSRPGAESILANHGAITSSNPKLRIVFCRDNFDYPQLFEHDLICEELAPVFKGRPRKKTKKNSIPSAKSSAKKPGHVTNPESPLAPQQDADIPTRRSSSRRRSKRKSPQKSAYELGQYSSAFSRSAKRRRRSNSRTPTPVNELTTPTDEKTNLELSFDLAVTSPRLSTKSASPAVGSKRKTKSKKRTSGRRSSATALSIAIKNSLLEHNKPSTETESVKSERARPDSSNSVTSHSTSNSSSRSSSPTTSFSRLSDYVAADQARKVPSPAGSVISATSSNQSNDPYATSSPDFTDIISSPMIGDEEMKQNYEAINLDDEILLCGINGGQIPENKPEFLELLHKFMRKRNTPIGRIPSLGFKKLDLWAFYKLSQEYGGYDMVTAKRLWKHVYDKMGGNPSCTSAATCTRKHFEKLLLPLEIHLRHVLRNREANGNKLKNSENSRTIPEEVISRSALQSKTYNGDAYFLNGAKVKPDSQQENATVSLCSTASTNPKMSDVKINQWSQATTMSQPHPLLNFETLAHNVIQDEIMTEKLSTKVMDAAPEDLSKPDQFTPQQNNSKKLQEVIDLTDVNNSIGLGQPEISRASVIVEQSNVSRTIPILLNQNSISSRTHCPRMSGKPPPFVPTKSKQTILTSTRPAALIKTELPHNGSDLKNDENRTNQKRLYMDEPQTLSNSTLSPKRPRKLTSQQNTSPGNRSFEIRNLIPHEEQKVRTTPLIRHDKETNARTDFFRPNHNQPRIENNVRGPDNQLRPSQMYHAGERSHRNQNSKIQQMYETPNSTYHEQKSYQPRPDAPTQVRQSHHQNTSRTRPDHAPPSSSTYSHESLRKETYYRPKGLLATSRDQHKHLVQSNLPKPERHTDSRISNERVRPRSPSRPDDVKYIPSHKVSDKLPNLPQKNSHLDPNITPRKSFSSSFTVDRLTSTQHDARHHLPSISMQQERFPVSKTAPQPNLCDRKHSFNQSNVSQSPYRTPTRPELPSEFRRDSRNHVYPTDPKLHGHPPKENGGMSTSAHSILSSLPPALASAIYPCIPKDCTPEMLERILQTTHKMMLPGAAGVPPIPGLPLPHTHNASLQESILRQQQQQQQQQQQNSGKPFRIVTYQEQQAKAATELARASMLANPPNDPAYMMQFYQFYSQLASLQPGYPGWPLTDPSLGPNPGNMASETAKISRQINGELIHRAAHLNGTHPHQLNDLHNPALLVGMPPLGSMPPDLAAALYSSYAGMR